MSARTAFVCQWFPPEPAVIPHGIASGLEEAGLDVRVLTGVPNYPTGEVADGYRAWRLTRERLHGLSVTRAPLFPSHDSNAARRALNYLTWAASSALFGQRLLRWSNVALVYSSPATAALPAMLARRLWGTPYVLLVQDVWPDSVFASGFLRGRASRLAERLLDVLVSATYRSAAHVAVISPGMVDLLAARGVPAHKLSVVYNWVEELPSADPEAARRFRTSLGIADDEFVLMYAGNHGVAQNLRSVIEAFISRPEISERCHLVLVGGGVEKDRLRQQAGAHPRIYFVDPQPRSAMNDLMAAADAQLVSLADEPLFSVTMPSKVQSALAAGTPILVAANGDAAAVVVAAGAGEAVPPNDPAALAQAVARMSRMSQEERAEMGERGRTYYRDEMSASVGVTSLRRLLLEAAGNQPKS